MSVRGKHLFYHSSAWIVAVVLGLLLVSEAAVAQTVPQPVPPWLSTPGPGTAGPAEAHRLALDQLRDQADRRAAFARQQAFETRLRRLELEAARQPAPLASPAGQRLGTPAQERARREAATARRHALAEGLGQIDAWLDRPAH